MRKFISAIMAILVLVLSGVPCSDVAASPANGTKSSVIHLQAGGHGEGHEHGIELCTPFCTCGCCASTALPVYHLIELQQHRDITEKVFAAYLPQAPAEVFLPIWQPPRLG